MVRKFLNVLLIILALCSLSCKTLSPGSTEGTRREAIDLIGEGIRIEKGKNFTLAIEKYLQAISISPRPAAYYRAAKCYSEIGELDKAAKYYEETISMSPGYKNAANELESVNIRKRTGQAFFSSSVNSNDILKSINDSFAQSEKTGTLIASSEQNQKKKKEDAKPAPQMNDINKILFPSIYSEKHTGEPKEEKASGKQTELRTFDYHKGKAEFYKANGHYNAAIGEYADALKYKSDDLTCQIELASLYGKVGRTKKAEESFLEIIKNNSGNPLVYFKYGNFCFISVDFETAKNQHKKALAIDPNYIPSLNNMGVIMMREKNFSEAINYFNQIISVDPKYSNAYLNLGIIHEESIKDIDKAIQYYNKYIQLGGEKKSEVEKWLNNLMKKKQ